MKVDQLPGTASRMVRVDELPGTVGANELLESVRVDELPATVRVD